MNPSRLNRRTFLRGTGVALALPLLESLTPARLFGTDVSREPRRLILINTPLGIYRDAFRPKETGRDYVPTEYLSMIDDFRDDYTVLSGLDHPGVSGGHAAESRIFSAVPSASANQLSLDQRIASEIGTATRFASLALQNGRNNFSWTATGTQIPAESRMADVYAKLFVEEGGSDKNRVLREIGMGKSLLDLVSESARSLEPTLSRADREKLEEYFDAVRDSEKRLTKSEAWVHQPKPSITAAPPVDPSSSAEIVTKMRNICDMTLLALKTDSTRVVTFDYYQQNTVNVEGVRNGYHPLSHHGLDPNNIAQLKLIEKEFFREFRKLLSDLRNAKEGDASLLERTTILVTSNLGNGSNHSNKDLPVLLAGGRFAHGQHLAFEPSTVPLSNLYVSILQQFGIDADTFGTSTGSLEGLQIV